MIVLFFKIEILYANMMDEKTRKRMRVSPESIAYLLCNRSHDRYSFK